MSPERTSDAPSAEDATSVLLVDNEDRNLLVYESMLSDLGATLVMARSGRDALRAALGGQFAAILLDVNMPGMDGFETAELLRSHSSFATTPLIFTTAYPDDLYASKAYALGAVDYVLMPAAPEVLRTKVKVFVDLDRAKRRIEAQNELMRRRALFLTTVSHELRTPLNVIHSWAEILAKESQDPEIVARGVEVIRRNTERQLKLVNELLDASRLSRGAAMDLRATSMRALVDTAVNDMRPVAAAKGIALEVVAASSSAWVEIDVDRMHQVISNILTNASKFTPAGGRIEVTLSDEPDTVELRVRDTGAGIAPEFLPMVFDRFSQGGGRAASRAEHGLGLGLSVVREIVELHRGSVRAESAGVGQGSTFVVRLPRIPPEREPSHD
jgi:signal transduction histidine kinase